PTLLPTTLLVSLHVCGALRALHSFPTRRSSDLHVESFRLRDGVFSLIFTPATAPVESPANKSVKELSAASTLFGTPMLSRQKSALTRSERAAPRAQVRGRGTRSVATHFSRPGGCR